jgi:hypothetical protein
MNVTRIYLGIILAVLTAPFSSRGEQVGETKPKQSSAATVPDEVLNNEGIVQLKQLGLGESVLIEKIRSSKCNFDCSISGLTQLKGANIPDAVITAMMSAKSGASVTISPGSNSEDPNDPKTPHDSGIWLFEEFGGKAKMIQLEPTVYSQTKGGVAFFAQFGQSVKNEAKIRSAHAEIATTNRRPVFYFYFDKTQGGLSASVPTATSANEYTLAALEVSEADNNRKVVIGEFNAYSGSQVGTSDKSVRSFSNQKVSPGVYRVTPKEDLADGEYCFYYGAAHSGGGGKVFDFRIKGDPETEPKPSSEVSAQGEPEKKNWFKKTFSKKSSEPAKASQKPE